MIVTRFAPSPTGRFHIGVARTALFSFLWAKKNKGKFILRIDDTDKERSKKSFEDEIEKCLKLLGIEPDEKFRQSERFGRYKEVVEFLLEKGYAYRCYCSPDELEKYRENALKAGLNPKYPKTCRNLQTKKDLPYAVRFKVPDDIFEVKFDDIVMRTIKVETSEIEDFVLMRSDGTPTYNLASVVDDFDYKITDIIRGADHISNTPKQILLFSILGRVPNFAHLPLILPDEGEGKLSKREDFSSSIYVYDLIMKDGFLPEAIVNHLARLGWAYGDKETFSIQELIELFDITEVNSSPARYNFKKLYWLNSHWIKTLTDEDIFTRLRDFIPDEIKKTFDEKKYSILKIIPQIKIRVRTMIEMRDMVIPILRFDSYDQEGAKKFFNQTGKMILLDFKRYIESGDGRFEPFLKEASEKYGVKTADVAQTIRLAIYGKLVSPPLSDVIAAIGKDEAIKRIEMAINSISD
ncbi:MAG: glutamate--tRNA ligase [Candidatus Calescibacterium sp.]|nr:glutamate--tRNA ligase [Candidatus Calescibacterium sp.]MCX7733363.1 glutamate--tRNA ligase [bacterium]MDW8086714.1 glutamate--tRNA ligase [Candidatus Calescibacterium sp.]